MILLLQFLIFSFNKEDTKLGRTLQLSSLLHFCSSSYFSISWVVTEELLISLFHLFSYIGIWLTSVFPLLLNLPPNLRQLLKFHWLFQLAYISLEELLDLLIWIPLTISSVCFLLGNTSIHTKCPKHSKLTFHCGDWSEGGFFFLSFFNFSGRKRHNFWDNNVRIRVHLVIFRCTLTPLLCWQVSKELIKEKMEREV